MSADPQSIGMNRTGVQSSPEDLKQLLAATEATVPSTQGDESALADLRLSYVADAEPLGSMPVLMPVRSVMKGVPVERPPAEASALLVDKLAERLAFERTGTRLYEALIAKRMAEGDRLGLVPLARLAEIHAEEARHFALLTDVLRALGADPTMQTPSADLVAIEGAGWVQAVTEPRTSFAQSLHAILIAELADNEGWETLIALATKEGHAQMADRFASALAEEEEHLLTVRRWLSELEAMLVERTQ